MCSGPVLVNSNRKLLMVNSKLGFSRKSRLAQNLPNPQAKSCRNWAKSCLIRHRSDSSSSLFSAEKMVGVARIELATPAMSRQAHSLKFLVFRRFPRPRNSRRELKTADEAYFYRTFTAPVADLHIPAWSMSVFDPKRTLGAWPHSHRSRRRRRFVSDCLQ